MNATTAGGCQINPSLISYSQQIQQGTKTPLPMITFSPTNCPTTLSLTASSVSIQGGILTPEGQKPISVASVVQDGVNLVIDTTGLNTQQTYSSTLNINAFSKQFQIPFVIVVSAGTSPTTNVTSSNLPSCSVTNNIININTTYSLVCNNIQPDVTVIPFVDYAYIVGVGVEKSATQFIWKFQAIKFGNTNLTANFNYQNAPIGTPFRQQLKISSSGQATAGTFLTFVFTPSLNAAREGENVSIQIADNKTGSLVSSPSLLIDAESINSIDDTFKFIFKQDKTYQLRGRSPGYDDLIMNVELSSQAQTLTIKPETADSATTLNITSNAVNASIYIDGTKVPNPYIGTLSEGSHEIKSIKEGYFDAVVNFTVDASINVTFLTEFKKGVPQVIFLNKNVSWRVDYQEDYASLRSPIAQGVGEEVVFTPNKYGIYTIIANDRTLSTNELKSSTWSLYGYSWWKILIGLALIGLIIKFVFFRAGKEDITAFSGAPRTG